MKNKTIHLFEDNIYLVSNHSVARNPMFSNTKMQSYFIDKMEKYLSPISDIVAHSLHDNEFQILVKLKHRATFVDHYLGKQKGNLLDFDVPETTYIFSQAMANLQVSFVKHFNHVYERSGTLVAGRYSRELITSEEEMKTIISKLNIGIKKHNYRQLWANDLMKSDRIISSSWLYEGLAEYQMGKIGCYLNGVTNDLGSTFESLPPLRLSSTQNFFFNQILKIYRQNKPQRE